MINSLKIQGKHGKRCFLVISGEKFEAINSQYKSLTSPQVCEDGECTKPVHLKDSDKPV